MTYLRRSNVSGKKQRSKIIAIVFLLVILFGLQYFFPKFYPTIFYPVTHLAWQSETGFIGWLGHMGRMVGSKYSLILENERLNREIRANQTSMLLLSTYEEENTSLKESLGRKPQGKVVLASVLARPPISPYDTLIVDRGGREGINVGSRVYTEGDVLIGEVAEVFPRESKIALYSTPGKKTPVTFNSAKIQTEALGRGGGNFTVTVPIEAGIKTGDSVVIPGSRIHTLGIVENVKTDPADSFATILFKFPININDIRFVEIQIE
jgi:cell shape-determining protein MreC